MIDFVLRRVVRRNQRGAILLLAVPGIILAVSSLALSVDLGRQALEKRTNQKVADLAALDAVRDITNAQSAAEASAKRNGFDVVEDGNVVLAERGSVDAQRAFSLDPAGDAVRVTVTSVIDYIFAPGTRTVVARAVGQLPLPSTTTTTAPPNSTTTTSTTVPTTPQPSAGFTIGSTLASIDTTKAPMLDRVLGEWLQGAASAGGNADVVGWQGLLTSRVTMGALADHLELLDAGVQFGTLDQILDAEITIGELAEAMGGALAAKGDANSALYFGPTGIIAQATNANTITLGDLFEVGLSGGASLATFRDAPVNPFELLTGSAMVANGPNLVSVPNLGITIPGLGTTGITLKVIEGRKTYIGPAGNGVSTGQVELTLTTNLDRPLNVAGLAGARLTGTFPLSVTAAGAKGTLSTIACSAPGAGIRVEADLKPFSSSTSANNLIVSATVLGSPVPVFSVNATGGVAATDPTPATLDFAYPGDFWEPDIGQRAGASPVNLDAMSTYDAAISTLGLTPVPGGLAAAVTGELVNATRLLDEEVMADLHRTLGVSIGAVDVAALKDAFDAGCAAPAVPPVTTTTTTATTTPPPTTPTTTAPQSPKLVG